MPDLTGRIEGEKMGLFGKKKVDFVSPAGGRLMNITEVADPAFSSKMLGDGFAVDLTDGTCFWLKEKRRIRVPDPCRNGHSPVKWQRL